MNRKRIAAVLVVSLLVCFMMLAFVEQACAQGGGDWKEKEGLSGLFARKSTDDGANRVSPLQKFIGIGSIFVMIAVLKYL